MKRLLHRVRDWLRRPVTLRETYFD